MAEKEATGSCRTHRGPDRGALEGRRISTARRRHSSSKPNLNDPSGHPIASPKRIFPECFEEYADMLTWCERWRHGSRHERPAVLEMVRRGQDQRLLQLHRPQPGEVQEQGGDHLRPGAGGRRSGRADLSGALHTGQRIRGAAAGLCRAQGGGPRHDPHADGGGAADHDAGVREARRDPLRRVRRIFRRSVRHAGRRLGKPGADLHGRLLPHRQDDRPQGERRDRGRDSGEGRPEDRQGPRLEAISGQVCLRHADGQGPRLLRRRGPQGLSPRARGARSRWTPRRRCS